VIRGSAYNDWKWGKEVGKPVRICNGNFKSLMAAVGSL